MIFKNVNANLAKLLAVAVAVAGCVFNANATVADVSYKVGGTSDLLLFNNIDFTVSGKTTVYNNVYAGGEQISQPSGSKDGLPNSYVSVCTDFQGSLYVGSTYKFLGSATPLTSATGIDPKWNDAPAAIQFASELFNTYGDLGSGGMGTGGKTMTVEQMAALQLAVWMVLYDTSGTGSSAKVTVNSSSEFYISSNAGDSATACAAILLADQWVANLTCNYNNIDSLLQPDPTLGVQGNKDDEDPQELLFCSVPEPTTILAGVLLLLPLGMSTIRNLRKSQGK
jgi:hypothetical protein